MFMVFNSCSDEQGFKDTYYNGVKPNFSKSDVELGSLLSESLSETTKKIKKENIDLKNQSAIQKISSEITLEVIGKKYAIPKDEMLMLQKNSQNQLKSAAVSVSFTTMQQRALNVIEHARTHSKSALAYMDKLAAINNRVDDLVPEGERQLLHQMIASEYYLIREINKLVRLGYLPGNSEYRPKIKTGTTIAFSDTSLLDLTKIAHANGEVEVLPEVVVVAPGTTDGGGISASDWYLLQDVYGNSYEDGSDNSYDNGIDSQDSSWYNCYDYSYGDGVMACMEDVYSNHGFLSLWVSVQSAFIPQTALAFAVACAIDAYPSDGECYESFN